MQALVDREGSIGLLLDREHFKWEEVNAWTADLKFGPTYRHKTDKLATVGDKCWPQPIANLADPFYAHESDSSMRLIGLQCGSGCAPGEKGR